MGALTLKTFPFELRGWDIEKLESVDPTDAFGSDTLVYVNKNKIVQVEPNYDINSENTWLTDKGRQFFDSVFQNQVSENTNWSLIFESLIQNLYINEYCQLQQGKENSLTIVFENVSLETLGLLNLLSQLRSFIKVRRLEKTNVNNDFETKIQLHNSLTRPKLLSSTFCLLITTNPRFEGYQLNLNLRQRYFKGNFKCALLGSLLDLTFPVSFLGNNLGILKSLIEGNHLICQEIQAAKNPIVVLNSELSKRSDGKELLKALDVLKHTNVFNTYWNGVNVLNSSLGETGANLLSNFKSFTEQDLRNSNSIYFLNTGTNNLTNFKKLVEMKILENNGKVKAPLVLEQVTQKTADNELYNYINANFKAFEHYHYLPASMFYENEETFFSTDGYLKRTNKLVFKKETKSGWHILRKLSKLINEDVYSLKTKHNHSISFSSEKLANLRIYSNFHYQVTQTLTNINFYLTDHNKPFYLNLKFKKFKERQLKLKMSKLKFWLNDFYCDGKDEYSNNSLVLTNCSKILRKKQSNFF